MTTLLPRRLPYVCKSCRAARRPRQAIRTYASIAQRPATLQDQIAGGRRMPKQQQPRITQSQTSGSTSTKDDARSSSSILDRFRPTTIESREQYAPKPSPEMLANPEAALKQIQEDALKILESDTIPKDEVVRDIFARAAQLATVFSQPPPQTPQRSEVKSAIARDKSSSLLADLDEPQTPRSIKSQPPAPTSTTTADRHLKNEASITSLLRALYTLLEDPKVFISEPLLTTYVRTCTTLASPQYLPKIFHLYTNKPIPIPESQPIRYRQPWSRMPKYGVSPQLIDMAMESAIRARDMPLCISMIDTTLSTDAYKSAKFVRKALLPLLGASSIIPLSHAASVYASTWQMTWEPQTFYWMCVSGATAYLGTMGTLLWITVSTWNDHHKRVRWVPGTPLGRRWIREDERYWFDRVAQAWGFEDENRHGEETGEEWEALREVLGRRYLELDRSSLLPGML